MSSCISEFLQVEMTAPDPKIMNISEPKLRGQVAQGYDRAYLVAKKWMRLKWVSYAD